jgi:hypothetical protein
VSFVFSFWAEFSRDFSISNATICAPIPIPMMKESNVMEKMARISHLRKEISLKFKIDE